MFGQAASSEEKGRKERGFSLGSFSHSLLVDTMNRDGKLPPQYLGSFTLSIIKLLTPGKKGLQREKYEGNPSGLS